MLKVRIGLSLLIAAIPLAAWASPHTAICLAEPLIGNPVPGFDQTIAQAKTRVEKVLWKPTASPKIVVLNGQPVFGLFNYNPFGSTVSLPHKTCVLVGPKGSNVDVVAHELVHAENAHQLGYWSYYWLPRWLDEGIAMQVDFRERYNDSAFEGLDPHYVTSKTGADFYQGSTQRVVQNYAAARAIVKSWVNKESVSKLREQLLHQRSELINSFTR